MYILICVYNGNLCNSFSFSFSSFCYLQIDFHLVNIKQGNNIRRLILLSFIRINIFINRINPFSNRSQGTKEHLFYFISPIISDLVEEKKWKNTLIKPKPTFSLFSCFFTSDLKVHINYYKVSSYLISHNSIYIMKIGKNRNFIIQQNPNENVFPPHPILFSLCYTETHLLKYFLNKSRKYRCLA